MAEKQRYIIEAIDKFSANFKKLDRKVNFLGKKFERLGDRGETANRRLRRAFGQTNDRIKRTSRNVRNLDSNFRRLGTRANRMKMPDVGRSMGITSLFMGNLKTMGAIFGTISGIGFAKELFQTTVGMENVDATLGAVLKRYNTGKSDVRAIRDEFKFLKDTAKELGTGLEGSVKPYAKFLAASKFTLPEGRKIFKSFAKLGRVFGMSSPELTGIIRALEQMQSKGKVMAEELRLQLGDRMPGALKLFADAAGLTTAQFIKLMEQGRISARIIKLVGQQIEKDYGEKAAAAMKTLGAETERLKNKWFLFKVFLGKKLTPAFRGTISMLSRLIDSFTGAGKNKGLQQLGNSFSKLIEKLKPLGVVAAIVKESFKGMLEFITLGVTGIIDSIVWLLDMADKLMSKLGFINKESRLAMDEARQPFIAQTPGLKPTAMSQDPEFIEQMNQVTLSALGINQSEQQISINVNFDNLPNGAKTEVESSSKNLNLNIGNNFAPAY